MGTILVILVKPRIFRISRRGTELEAAKSCNPSFHSPFPGPFSPNHVTSPRLCCRRHSLRNLASLCYRRIMTSQMDANTIEIPLPAGSRLSLRPVTADAEEFLLSVYASTRDAELSQADWAEGQREAFVKWQFEMQRREYDVRFPDAEYNVVMVDEERAGRIWIGRDDEHIRLLDIGLLPEFQNRGAGKVLLQRLIDESARTGKALRHMVFVLNNDAHRFYERLGFVMIEEFGAYKHMEWRSANK